MLKRSRALSISLIILCQSMQALVFGGVALFLPLIRSDIGLSFSQAGTLAAGSALTYALMQVPSGYLADRFGPKRVFLAGLLGVNVLSFTFAVLGTYPLLLANQTALGVFRAFMFAPGMLLISSQFPADRRDTAMGLYVAGGFSSNIVLNSLGPLLVGPLGWQALFMLFSGTGLLLGVTYWKAGHPDPDRTGLPPVRLGDVRRLFRHPVLWFSAVVQFVRLAVVMGLAFWLPTYIVEDKGFSLTTAGLVVALGAAVTAPSNFFGGYISDRLGRPTLVIGTCLAVLAVTISLLINVGSLPVLIGVIAVNSVFVQLYFGPLFGVPIRVLGSEAAGLLTGFSNFCANLGGLAATYTLGAVKDATGSFAVGLYGLAGLCVVGLVCNLGLSRTLSASRAAAAGTAATSTSAGRRPAAPVEEPALENP
jgi:ACS family D-galactonate transporter-like MFS transporter